MSFTLDRVQGLIDLYPTKTKNAVMVLADYYVRQGVISKNDCEAVLIAIEAKENSGEKIDLKQLVEERMQYKKGQA